MEDWFQGKTQSSNTNFPKIQGIWIFGTVRVISVKKRDCVFSKMTWYVINISLVLLY